MKRNIHKNLLGLLRSKGILAISGGLLLMSCGAQMGGYSETDGVYYDPNKDTLPEGVIINGGGNRVGEYYDYYQDSNIIQNAQTNSREQQNKYNEWGGTDLGWSGNATDSDWGLYAGSQTNYYDNSWGWGSPWGWYGGYSPYWGMNRGWGWGLGMSWGWGGSFGWGWGGSFGWGSPYWGYSPYWGGYYDPFWGGYYGNPYWGYGGGYWGHNYYNRPYHMRSGSTGGFVGNPGIGSAVYRTNTANTGSGFRNGNNNSGGFRDGSSGGFRNGNSGGFRDGNSGGFRQGNSGGFRQGNSGGFRDGNSGGFRQGNSGGFRNSVPQSRPDYNYQQPRNNGGFRSMDSGGFRSGSGFGGGGGGGGFRGGSGGGGGGFRSGGSGGFR